MTVFILVCALMILAALALVVWPLRAAQKVDDKRAAPQKNYAVILTLAIVVPVVASLLYMKVGRPQWQRDIANAEQRQPAGSPDVLAMVAKLEQRLHDAPNDVEGWLMLGRSYVALEKAPQALNAYQKAYDLSAGTNLDAAMGLGEAMIMVDDRAFTGKAGELFEQVLAKEPDNAKALWYGAIGALASGNLPRAHERLTRILTLGPPENIRSIIERQLQDIQQQMAAADPSAVKPTPLPAPTKAAQSPRALAVQVSIDPNLAKALDQKTPLFVLARNPGAAGPPLAAVRRAVGDLPLSVTITDGDAMIQGRGISGLAQVQVVARISKSGTPQAQPGDLYGEALVALVDEKPASVKIVINRVVETAGGK